MRRVLPADLDADVGRVAVQVGDQNSALADLLKYMSEQRKKYRWRRSLRSRIACSAKLGKKVNVGDFVTIEGSLTFSDTVIDGRPARIVAASGLTVFLGRR